MKLTVIERTSSKIIKHYCHKKNKNKKWSSVFQKSVRKTILNITQHHQRFTTTDSYYHIIIMSLRENFMRRLIFITYLTNFVD